MSGRSLVLVVPVFNEIEAIPFVLADCAANVLDRIPGASLLVIDDGSTDGSAAWLDDAARRDPRVEVMHKPNGGHGSAILEGYRRALALGAAWVGQSDGDGQLPAGALLSLWNAREGAVLVRARRSDPSAPVYRRTGAAVERLLIRLLFGIDVPDANAGCRLMDGDFLSRALPLVGAGDFAPNIALSVAARVFHPSGTALVPVAFTPRLAGRSSLTFERYVRSGVRVVGDLLKLRRRLSRAAP